MKTFKVVTQEVIEYVHEVEAEDITQAVLNAQNGKWVHRAAHVVRCDFVRASVVDPVEQPKHKTQVVSGEKAKRKYKRKLSKGAFGQHNPMPPAVAKQIYDLVKVGNFTYRQIAEKFRTSKQTVQNIASGRLHYPDLLKQAA